MAKNILAGEFKQYCLSFKEFKKRRLYHILLLDAGVFILLYLAVLLWGKAVKSINIGAAKIHALGGSSMQLLALQQDKAAVSILIWKMLLLTVLFLLALCIIWSIMKGIVWCRLLNKKFSFNYAWRFFLLNIIWSIVLLIPFYLYLKSIMHQPAASGKFMALFVLFAILFIGFYFTFMLYYHFTKKEKVFASIYHCFKDGIMKIGRLILPYLFLTITLAAVSIATMIFKPLPALAEMLFGCLFFFVSLAWSKLYFSSVLENKLGKGRKRK